MKSPITLSIAGGHADCIIAFFVYVHVSTDIAQAVTPPSPHKRNGNNKYEK